MNNADKLKKEMREHFPKNFSLSEEMKKRGYKHYTMGTMWVSFDTDSGDNIVYESKTRKRNVATTRKTKVRRIK